MSVGLVFLAILGCISQGNSIQPSIKAIPDLRFVTEPVSTSVAEGQSLSLRCRAICNCTGLIRYSWIREGQNISTTLSQSSDLNAGNLVITKFSRNRDAGKYACLAEVDSTVIRSLESDVTVARLTTAKVVTLQQQVSHGSITALKCVSDNVPKAKVQQIKWYQNDQLLRPGSKVILLSSDVLVLKGVTLSHQGKFKCMVTNDVTKKTVESEAVPIIISKDVPRNEAPTFQLKPTNQTITIYKRTSILCVASGSPTPSLTLYKENKFRKGDFVEITTGSGIISHSLPSASLRDDGVYRCVATSNGKKIATDAWIHVLVPPSFPSGMKDRLVRPQGGEATLRCSAVGFPTPKVEWFIHGKKIKSESGLHADVTGKLRISATKLSDSGIYQCFASNTAGKIKHSILFFVREEGLPLQAPQNVTGKATSPSTIEVFWDPPKLDDDEDIVAYTVLWKENKTTKERSMVVDAKKFSASIDRLFGGTVYEIVVRIYASKKTGKASKVIYVRTPEGVPRIAPSNVRIRNDGSGKLVVNWSGIAREFSNGHILKYTIFYGKVGGQSKKRMNVSADQFSAEIKGLQEGDLYTVEVAAMTSKGYGPASKMVSIKVADPNETDLDRPAMTWKWINKTAVNVSWNLPISSIQVTGFKMLYINTSSEKYFDDVKIHYFPASVHHYAISGLERKYLYRLELSVLSNGMQGRAAYAVLDGIVHNALRPLDPARIDLSEPRDVQCETKDANSIFLSWSKPTISRSLDDYTAYASRNHQSETMAVRSKEQKYLFTTLKPGKWYYLRVASNKRKSNGISGFSSKYIACKTFETKPGPPQDVSWKLSYKRSKVIVLWYTPANPNGLVTRYTIRYRMISSGSWTTKVVDLASLNPRLRYPSIRTDLDVVRSISYKVEVAGENSAGLGVFAQITIPEAKEIIPGEKPTNGIKDGTGSLVDSEVKMGIIIGCSIATVFVVTLVIVFIWKNPFRLKSAERRPQACNGQGPNGAYLYLQRMQDGTTGNGVANGHYGHTYLPSSNKRNMNGYTPRDAPIENGGPGSNGGITRHVNTADVTGSSSGPPICTCVCFQHGRNGHQRPNDRVNQVSRATSTRDDELPVDGGSTASEERESAESADSRTQMLPSRQKDKHNDTPRTTTRDYLHMVQETTFHV